MQYLSTLVHSFEHRGEQPYLLEAGGDRRLTYGEARRVMGGVAARLRGRGLGPGSRLGLGMTNSFELAALYLGALMAGVTVVPLAGSFGRRELQSILSRTPPDLFVGDPGNVAAAVAAELGVRVAGEDDPLANPLALEAPSDWHPFDGVSSLDLASIHFTSGSTGEPRAVAHRIRDFVSNAQRFAQATAARPCQPLRSVRCGIAIYGCDVLINGARYRLVGAVSMDNITVDLGRSPTACPGPMTATTTAVTSNGPVRALAGSRRAVAGAAAAWPGGRSSPGPAGAERARGAGAGRGQVVGLVTRRQRLLLGRRLRRPGRR